MSSTNDNVTAAPPEEQPASSGPVERAAREPAAAGEHEAASGPADAPAAAPSPEAAPAARPDEAASAGFDEVNATELDRDEAAARRRDRRIEAGGIIGASVLVAAALVAWLLHNGPHNTPRTAAAEYFNRPKAPTAGHVADRRRARRRDPRPTLADLAREARKRAASRMLRLAAAAEKRHPATGPATGRENPEAGSAKAAGAPKPAAATKGPTSQPTTASAGGPEVLPRYQRPPAGYTLTGILRGPSGHLAAINGRMVAVGGTVKRAKVIKIRPLSVEMELDGRRFTLGVEAQDTLLDANSEAENGDGKAADESG